MRRSRTFFSISLPAEKRLPPAEVPAAGRKFRNRTFWGVTASYSLYYLCRMALSVVKQPLIDGGLLSARQLGLIGSAFSFVYAVGKLTNGFLADYCNIRRFMAAGLLASALINLIVGASGLFFSATGGAVLLLFLFFTVVWGLNGWAQSMGSAPAVISLSRWFPLSRRGSYYSLLSSTPYIGKFISMVLIGYVVALAGWPYGFMVSAVGGLIGTAVVLIFVSDTPESKGLPSVRELSGEPPQRADDVSVRQLHKAVCRHPGIWVIALSSAFVYVTQYGLSNWGILFLQKAKGFRLTDAAWTIGLAEAFGIAGTVCAGWLSDKVFKGDRVKPVLLSGTVCLLALAAFLFTGGGVAANTVCVGLFSLSIGIVYCVVAGLMALDMVPRKATGAALGVVGISSYIAVGIQDIVSGCLIHGGAAAGGSFTSAAVFWTVSCAVSFLLPAIYWKYLERPVAL